MFSVFAAFRPLAIFSTTSGASTGGTPTETFHLLLESGDALLLESGDHILTEAA